MPILKERATYQDLIEAPDIYIAEILDGDLHGTRRLPPRDSHVASMLFGKIYNPFDRDRGGPGRWFLLRMIELHFGDDVLVPDLMGWQRERLPRIPDVPWMSLAPDWVCEVIAPPTEPLDRVKKLRIYAREGVTHAWLLNPATKDPGGPSACRVGLDAGGSVRRK